MGVQRLIYGRRLGHRLRPERRRLLTERLPELQVAPPEEGQIEPRGWFDPTPREVWLEIGFGGGEHLAALAAAHPEVGIIGCEPYIGGVARLLGLLEAQQSANVRLVVDDARVLLRALPDGAIGRIFVLFPDPWPKTRHHKRRIVNPSTAAEFARLIEPGGELRLATDDMNYARAMLQALLPQPELSWLAERPLDWRTRRADWPPTRYEQKAIEAGRRCVYLRFRRLPGRVSPNGEKILKGRSETPI